MRMMDQDQENDEDRRSGSGTASTCASGSGCAARAERPRLAVFRSVAHIYVQAIDDADGQTVAAASSVEPA
jgi:ribosomal protein L18